MNKDAAAGLLRDMHWVLETLNLKHFIIDGTLLGAVREGDFIGHDTDIDFGVFAEEWTEETVEKLRYELRKKKIKEYHTFGELNEYYELSFTRDDIKCDLFFYRREPETEERGALRIFHAFVNGGVQLPQDVITYEYPAELIEDLKPIVFQNNIFPAPADPIAVLVTKYGPDWKTPVKEWDWAFGPKNVRTKK